MDEAKLTIKIGELLKKIFEDLISDCNSVDLSKLEIKKPNDILYANKKLAGILVELKADLLVIGIGINLEIAPIPDSICLKEISPQDFDKAKILEKLRVSIDKKLLE